MTYWITFSLLVGSCMKQTYGSNCLLNPSGSGLPCDCCKPGFGGFNCTQSCPGCDSRVLSDNSCFKHCKDGYFGHLCNIDCSEYCKKGKRGQTVCRKEDGECFNGCVPGHFGLQCGLMCKSNCHNNECLQKDGSCNSCKQNLYYGKHCSWNCSKGCSNGTCEMDGRCIDGCQDGYHGRTCSLQCGSNCVNLRCTTNMSVGFSCVDGCTEGYTSMSCSERCPEHCVKCNQHTGRCSSCELNYVLKCDYGDCGNDLTCQRQEGLPAWVSAIIVIVIVIVILIISIPILVYIVRQKIYLRTRGHSDNKEDPEKPLLSKQRTEEAGSSYKDGDINIEMTEVPTLPRENEQAYRQRLIKSIHGKTRTDESAEMYLFAQHSI